MAPSVTPKPDAPKLNVPNPGASDLDAPVAYAELHCLSNFSFLRGASHPEELVEQAAALGYAAIAISDRNSLAGVVRAHVAWKRMSDEVAERRSDEVADKDADSSLRHSVTSSRRHFLPKLIIGAEITPVDAPPLVLLAPTRPAYGRLCRLITRGRLRCRKGACEIRLADIVELCTGSGLIAIVVEESDEVTERRSNEAEATEDSGSSLGHSVTRSLHHYHAVFDGLLFLAATLRCDVPDAQRLAEMAELSERTGIPLVATNAVLYHEPQRRYLQDVLTCIREKCTLAEAGSRLMANAERHLRPRGEIARRYTLHADARLARIGREAIARTLEIAGRCTFTLDELRYEYPHELVPEGATAMEHLEELVWAGAAETYGGKRDEVTKRRSDEVAPEGETDADQDISRSDCVAGRPDRSSCGHPPRVIPSLPSNIHDVLRAELALIRDLGYEHYFLTVHDLVRFARARGILCQGRGSAANSAVCYCLGITAVDPARHDLLFERFISRERNEPPDIDVDFEHERREEVFQYIYQKYGRERAGIAAEVISYRPRSAVRDVGKALGLSLDAVDVLAKAVDWFDDQPLPEHALQSAGVDANDRTIRMLVRLVRQILGFPRHLSQHVGGFVITETPLCEIVPLENGAMPERTFIEWNKDDIDALGILKVDCLALGMLTAVRKCLRLLRAKGGIPDPRSLVPSSLRDIPPEDPRVYDMICRADTVGVFQIESRAQMSMLPRLKPRNFYDLVIEVAIVRPGPIQGGMVHPYLRRRDGLEEVTYPSDDVRRVLHKTLGVPIFQEQVMRLAVVAAGFTPGEADQLRRAMAAWRRSGDIQKFQIKLIRGMLARGFSREFAEQIYRQIQGFGEYGFPESHSASFAILVYASAWLKRYRPAAFCAAMLNSQPLGFYTPGQLIRDAIAHGVEVRPVDVLHSEWDCTLEESDGVTERRSAEVNGDDDPASWGTRGPALRLGLRLVRRLSQDKAAGITHFRRVSGPSCFHASAPACLRAFLHHSSRDTLLRLAAAAAFRSLGLSRRQALWQILALDRDDSMRRGGLAAHTPSLFAELEPDEPPTELPRMPLEETVVQDYDAQGFSLNAHPIGLVRPELDEIGSRSPGATPRVRIVRAADLRTLRHGRRAAVAGLVTLRQRPGTAKGMVFMTLEDETGMANLVIRPNVWERERRVARGSAALIAEGVVERKGEVIHVMARRFFDLAGVLHAAAPGRASLPPLARHPSRDFH